MAIDYSKYSVRDLIEVRERITPDNAPENYERFMQEYENRKDDIEAYFEQIKVGSEKQIAIIGWVQIASGVILILATIYNTFSEFAFYDIYSLFLQAIGLLLGAFSILAGNKLVKGDDKGITYSVINQAIQLPAFSIGIFSYNYNALGGIYFTVDSSFNPGFSALFAPGTSILFGDYAGQGFLSIDLISLVILLLLRKYVGLHEEH